MFPTPDDPGGWALEVGGLVRKPTRFTRAMLRVAAAHDATP